MTTREAAVRDLKAQRAARSRYAVGSVALERCALILYEAGLDTLAGELASLAEILRKASAREAEPKGGA